MSAVPSTTSVWDSIKNLGSKAVSGVGSVAVGAKNLAVSGVTKVASAAKGVVGAKPAADVAANSTAAPAGGRRRKSRKSKKSKKSKKTRRH